MSPSTSPPSTWSALRYSAAASLRACRHISRAAREAASTVTAAAAEHRGVLRTICMAMEQTLRAAVRATRALEEQSVPAWRPVPLIGRAAGWSITAAARMTLGILSVLVAATIAGDVLLNTVAEWEKLHPRFRSAGGPPGTTGE